jgi:putative ABC transport system permease protein
VSSAISICHLSCPGSAIPPRRLAPYHVPPAAAFPGLKRFSVSAANYLDWRKQNDVFKSISVFGGRALRLGGGSRPQSIHTTISDADFITVLGTSVLSQWFVR